MSKILIIEDEAAIRRVLTKILSEENDSYKVISIYMDDLVFTGAADKAFGNQVHKKYRVRYYDDPSKKKLELKYKVLLIGVHRFYYLLTYHPFSHLKIQW